MKETQIHESGCLYIVATPIGNLQDMTPRALAVLEKVDLLVAEDTRHSGALMAHFGLKKRMQSLHLHNETQKTEPLLALLKQGQSIALVSDAGTPLISDPGFELVRGARQAGLSVQPVPGASAVVAALSVSGLPCDRFSFEGFLPAKRSGRKAALEAVMSDVRTLVFYESPRRIRDCIADMLEVLGPERQVCVARELTKMYEEVFTLPLTEAQERLELTDPRGEYVVVLEGGTATAEASPLEQDKLLRTLLEYLSVKDAAAVAARLTDTPKKQLYQRLLELKE